MFNRKGYYKGKYDKERQVIIAFILVVLVVTAMAIK